MKLWVDPLSMRANIGFDPITPLNFMVLVWVAEEVACILTKTSST
jgi:hypothetical protein